MSSSSSSIAIDDDDFQLLNDHVSIERLNANREETRTSTTNVDEKETGATAAPNSVNDKLDISTFNVLFNVSERVQGGAVRYKHQMTILATLLNSKEEGGENRLRHCIGLQEVTQAWIDVARDFFGNSTQDVWLVSLPHSLATGSGHGFGARGRHTVAMITNFKPIDARAVRLAEFPRPALLVDFSISPHNTLRVAVVHTKPWVGDAHEELRARQLKALYDHAFVIGGGGDVERQLACVVGDFNLYTEKEADRCIAHPWLDAWKQLHDDDDTKSGFTFDSKRNLMIQQLMPRKTDRLRLDRITFRAPLHPLQIELFADAPVFPEAAQAAIEQQAQKSGGFISRGLGWAKAFTQPKSYLFPSDHFGIHCSFEIL